MRETKINEETRELLRRVEIVDPNRVKITQQLDRKQYKQLNDVLEALGGKWNRAAKAHVFDQPASELRAEFAKLVDKGTIATDSDYGWFPTPEKLATRLVLEKIGPLDGKRVLEPSAGEGAFASVAQRYGANVTCIELHPGRAQKLKQLGFETYCGDFLAMEPRTIGGLEHLTALPRLFDAILMNPPFAPERADLMHVEHAMRFLARGGELLAIMAAGITFRTDKKTVAFRQLLEEHGATIEPLPEGSFRESGTSVSTVVVHYTQR